MTNDVLTPPIGNTFIKKTNFLLRVIFVIENVILALDDAENFISSKSDKRGHCLTSYKLVMLSEKCKFLNADLIPEVLDMTVFLPLATFITMMPS